MTKTRPLISRRSRVSDSRETMLLVDNGALSSREAEQLRDAGFTYSEVGSTRGHTLPSGYGTLRRRREIGTSPERFEQAARVLLDWNMHRRAGLGVRTSTEHVVAGAVAVLRFGLGGLGVDAP